VAHPGVPDSQLELAELKERAWRQAHYNAEDYEKKRYQQGYGLQYPESHIIRVNKQILEWQLGIRGGKVFDFGCGSGRAPEVLRGAGLGALRLRHQRHRHRGGAAGAAEVERQPQGHAGESRTCPALFGLRDLQVFMSNQVLYFLDDADISLDRHAGAPHGRARRRVLSPR
jgi:hypothetical protein